jgi:hypothetical protein
MAVHGEMKGKISRISDFIRPVTASGVGLAAQSGRRAHPLRLGVLLGRLAADQLVEAALLA